MEAYRRGGLAGKEKAQGPTEGAHALEGMSHPNLRGQKYKTGTGSRIITSRSKQLPDSQTAEHIFGVPPTLA